MITNEPPQQRPSSVTKTGVVQVDHVFSNIDESKLGDKNREKQRKSIFDHVNPHPKK